MPVTSDEPTHLAGEQEGAVQIRVGEKGCLAWISVHHIYNISHEL